MDLEVQFLHRCGPASDHRVWVVVHIRQIQMICKYSEYPVSEESVHLLAAMTNASFYIVDQRDCVVLNDLLTNAIGRQMSSTIWNKIPPIP